MSNDVSSLKRVSADKKNHEWNFCGTEPIEEVRRLSKKES